MEIKATASGMEPFSTEELRQHVIAVDAKFQKMPASLRRNSMQQWPNNRGAILREIVRREIPEELN
jgi:hypothetical protein